VRLAPVFFGVIFLISPILLADVTVGPEREVSPPTLHAAAFDQDNPVVASDGSGWLAGWLSQSAIFQVTRVDATGNVLDSTPIVIDDNAVEAVTLTFGSSRYLAAWATYGAVHVCLIDRDGNVSPSVEIAKLDTGPVTIRSAWNGSRFVVAWTEGSTGSIRRSVVLLDENGTPATEIIRLSMDGSPYFDVAAGNGEFAFIDGVPDFSAVPGPNGYPGALRFLRLRDDGSVASRSTITNGTPIFNPVAAFDGRDYLVTWSSNLGLPGTSAGAFVSSSGEVRKLPDFYAGDETVSTLTWTGAEYLITLRRNDRVDVLRLDRAGVASSPRAPVVIDTNTNPSIDAVSAARNGTHLLVAVAISGDVVERFVSATGEIVDPSAGAQRPAFLDPAAPAAPLALSPNQQDSPAIASVGGGETMVVWAETFQQPLRSYLMAMPFRDGVPLLDEAQRVAQIVGRPNIASDGQQYLVVWTQQNGSLIGLRLDRTGTALGSPVTIDPGSAAVGRRAAVTFDGENFVVVYEQGAGCFHSARFRQVMARVTRTGELLSPGRISTPLETCYGDTVVGTGSAGAMVGVPFFSTAQLQGSVIMLVTREGTLGPLTPLPFTGTQLQISWTGSLFVVGSEFEWATLTPAGTLLSQGVISANPCSLTLFTNGVMQVFSSDTGRIFAACSASDGESVGQTTVSPSGFRAQSPSIATTGSMAAEVVYQRELDTAVPTMRNLTRVYVRSLKLPGVPLRSRAVH
jgi:hypothetical protein